MKLYLHSSISHATLSLRVPLAVSIALEVISGLQITHLILKIITQYNSQDETFFFVDLINYALSYIGEISPKDLFEESNAFIMFIWILFAIYFALHLIMLAFILISGIFFRNIIHTKLLVVLSWSYLVHTRAIFFIAHFLFMGLINSYNNCTVEGNTAFYCKMSVFAPTVILCILNMGIAIIKEFVLYQVLKNKDTYAVKNNLFNQITLLYKGVIIILYFLIQNSDSRAQVCAVVNIVFALLLLTTNYMKLPFYNMRVLKTSIAVNGIILSFSLLAILQIIGVKKKVLDIVWALVIPLVVKSTIIVFEIVSNKIIKGEFDTPEKALYFVSVLKDNKFGYMPDSLVDKNCSMGSIISNGILIRQNFDMERLKNVDSWREYEERIYLHLVDKLYSVLEKNPNSRVLLLTLARLCLKKLDNIPRTIFLVKRLESLTLSFPIKTSLDVFNRKLKEYYTKGDFEDYEKHLRLLSHFQYKDRAIALQKVMQAEVLKHIEFWEEMKKDTVDVKKVIDISCDIDNNALQVQKIFDSQFKGFTQHFINPLMMYGAYQELIKEYSDDARKLIKQFWSLARGQARTQGLDVYCEEIGVAIVSIEKQSLGAIVDCSGSMQTLFLEDKKNIVGQQLTFILPDFVANYLMKIIRNYAKIPSRKMEHTVMTYGKQRDGNFFEVEVQLKLYPKIDREVKLLLMFRKIAQPKSLLIVNTEGVILEASESLKYALNLHTKTKNTPIRFQDIAPEFDNINSAFNHEFSNEEGTAVLRSFSSKLPSIRSSRFHNNPNDTSKESIPPTMVLQQRDQKKHSSKFAKRKQSNHFTSFDSGNGNTSPQAKYKDLIDEFTQGGRILIKDPNDLFQLNAKGQIPFEMQIAPCQLNGEVYKILTLTGAQDLDKKLSLEQAKSNLFPSVMEGGEESTFADQFFEVDERDPDPKLLPQKTSMSEKFTPKVTIVSGPPQDNNQKESVKTPDLEQFVGVHTPAKGVFRMRMPHQAQSVSSTSSRTVASVKALKGIFGRNQTFVLAKRTTLILLLLVILMITLGIVNFSMSKQAVNQVSTGVSIVNIASLRLTQAMRGWQYANRMWLRYLKLRSGDLKLLQNSMLASGNLILQYDRKFTEALSSLIDKSLFQEIMASNINLWVLNESYATTGDPVDSITATNILANKMLIFGTTTLPLTTPIIQDTITYLSNNTCNDYLISSENLIAATQKMLQTTLSSNISNLQLILGLEIAAVTVLCIVIIFAGRILIQLYQRLFIALVKIDERFLIERQYQLQKMKTLLADDVEMRGYGVNILEDSKAGLSSYHVQEKAKVAKSAGTIRKGAFQKRSSERISVLKLFLDLAKFALVSLVVIQVITALFIVSLTQSLSNFRSSQGVTNQLSVTTQAAATASIIVSAMYMDMDFRNQTNMKVRNQSPQSQLLQSNSNFMNTNNDILAVFSKEGQGITDDFMLEVMNGGSFCKYLANDTTIQNYCTTATNYGQLGLLALNSRLMDNQNMFTTQYLANPTYANALSLIASYIANIRPAADTLQALYEVINAHIISLFEASNVVFLNQITTLHIGIWVSIVICACIVQRVTIKHYRFLDTRRGNILKVLSYKMLLEDKAIGFYLNKHFVSSEAALTRSL